MDLKYYLDLMHSVEKQLDKSRLRDEKLLTETGTYSDSVFLKLYKKSWTNLDHINTAQESKIFFSIWINAMSIREKRWWYNIHALKLRQLHGYKLESRKFADAFRSAFEAGQHKWPNVSVEYGPQTLMQGWVKFDLTTMKEQSVSLVYQFLTITDLIDNNLANFKKLA